MPFVSIYRVVNKYVENQEKRQYRVEPVKWRRKAGGGRQPYQGRYYPAYPEKYEGNVNKIMFRSGMELSLFKYLDMKPTVLKWSSEETVLRYRSPKDGNIHRYFVDAKVTTLEQEKERTYLIEVKPSYQCVAPNPPKKPNKRSYARFLREEKTYKVNLAKWNAAEEYCKKRGWTFLKLTEKDLTFGKK
jgi:hypothetical protein